MDATTGSARSCVTRLRVRYSETDRLGTYYNSRALEWFECGRTEWLRSAGIAYADMEARGVMLPLVEAHVNYLGRAKYDDELIITTTAAMAGKARMRFEIKIDQAAGGAPVASGWTVHVMIDPAGRPMRPPAWVVEAVDQMKPQMNTDGHG